MLAQFYAWKPFEKRIAHAGELPLELIRMKVKGCAVSLSENKGFTLPSNIGELGEDIKELDLWACSLQGSCVVPSIHEIVLR